MKIISMDLLIVPQVMDQHVWQFLVPDKRFKSHKLRQFDGSVPRKRFIRYQMPALLFLFRRNVLAGTKGTIFKRLKRCLSNFIQI